MKILMNDPLDLSCTVFYKFLLVTKECNEILLVLDKPNLTWWFGLSYSKFQIMNAYFKGGQK